MLIKVDDDRGGTICLEDDCPLKKECANHHTAGCYRTEGGMSPAMYLDDDGFVGCKKEKTESEGFVSLKDKRLVVAHPMCDDWDCTPTRQDSIVSYDGQVMKLVDAVEHYKKMAARCEERELCEMKMEYDQLVTWLGELAKRRTN